MTSTDCTAAIAAADVAKRHSSSNYPEPFATKMTGRRKRALGAVFGLSNFGVNLTEHSPGSISALRHAHWHQDEFVYVLQVRPVLRTNMGDTQPNPGMCAGFRTGSGDAHQLLNSTDQTVTYLEIGDRTAGGTLSYQQRIGWK